MSQYNKILNISFRVLIPFILLGCTSSDDEGKTGPFVISYKTGFSNDVVTTTSTGIALLGGADAFTTAETASFEFLVDRAGGGDFVVLRTSGADGYNNFIYSNIGNVNSVTTLIVDSREKAESGEVADVLLKAEAVFLAGGDQSNYLNFWKGTQLNQILNQLLNEKKIPIGGTSAGLAVLGEFYYGAYTGSATSNEILVNPFHANTDGLSGQDFLHAPFLNNIITDSHYNERNRQGRHFVFMARLTKKYSDIQLKGIGVDEATSVLIDEVGVATVIGSGNAYFLQASENGPELCEPRQALTWNREGKAVEVFKIPGSSGHEFKLDEWTGPEELRNFWYAVEGELFTD